MNYCKKTVTYFDEFGINKVNDKNEFQNNVLNESEILITDYKKQSPS
jgi:hypothetical protein